MRSSLPANKFLKFTLLVLLAIAVGVQAQNAIAGDAGVLADVDTDGDGTDNGQETVDGTDPDDADSVIEHGDREYCFDWNGFLGGMMQVLELRNKGCAPIDVRVDLRNSGGQVQDSVNLSLAVSRQFDVIVNQLNGFASNSYGLLCATITSGDSDSLAGRMSHYKLNASSFDYAFSTPYVHPRPGKQYLGYNHIYPTLSSLEAGYKVFAYVQISNEESSVQSGDLVLYNPEGVELRRDFISIPAKGRVDLNTHELGVNTVGTVEWSPTLTDKLFRVVLNRYYLTSSNTATAIVSIPAKRGSGYLLASPFDTDSRITALEINNTLSTVAHVTVSTYTAAGSLTSSQPGTITIPPKGTRHLVLNQYLTSGSGKVQIDATEPQSVIANLFEYGLTGSLGLQFANVGDLHAGFGDSQSTSYNNFLGGCKLRLANITSTPRSATVSMTRYDGTAISITSPINVPANGETEVNICSNESQLAYGELSITPSVSEAITGDLVRSNQNGSFEFRMPLSEQSICTADIGVSPASLSITAQSGTPGNLTVTNNSEGITAANIQATLPGSWTDVTQDASNCLTVAAGDSCVLAFTPGSTAYSQAQVSIQGTNTVASQALITVAPPLVASLSVSGSPLTFFTDDVPKSLTVTNLSGSVTALNITSDFTGTVLAGRVSQTSNTCASLAPSSSCTLTFTPGSSAVSQTSFPIAGTNTTTATAAIGITIPVIGDATQGGTVACLGGGLNNLIAATSDNSTGIIWGDISTATNAQSDSNGAANTATIVSVLGNNGGTPYAAELCDNYEVDSDGNTPCQSGTCYNDWFQPAKDQLNCLYTNRAAIGGFATAAYWTSTETSFSPTNAAAYITFLNGAHSDLLKFNAIRVRCVRAFTPAICFGC